MKGNIIILSLDEIRPDHLSCYGYKQIKTSNIDWLAENGVRFETCISSADFTPVAMAAAITGKYPHRNGIRDPFSYLIGPNIAEILGQRGYSSAGFVGNGLLTRQHGFASGFGFWNEASADTCFDEVRYPGNEDKELIYEGNYWVEVFFKWLADNHKEPFFMWGHLYETHEGSEKSLIERGLIEAGKHAEHGYYDAKILMADEKLVGRLIEALRQYGILDSTTIVVMSDHGTNLGEHPAGQIPWRRHGVVYPQHTTMYDHDLKVAMIVMGERLPRGEVIKPMIRSIDLVPSLLDLSDISPDEYNFDGKSFLPIIKTNGTHCQTAHSEDIFESRGKGFLQSVRTETTKFIRNLTLGTEEYYDLERDPGEQCDIGGQVPLSEIIALRKQLNACLSGTSADRRFSEDDKGRIKKRLQALGYVE